MTALDDLRRTDGDAGLTPTGAMPGQEYRSFIAPRYYFDDDVFAAELDRVFPRSWQLVGDVSGLVDTGDYLTEELGGQPVVVVRDQTGTLRCFANVCRHRGCTLLDGIGNTGSRMVCPYHNWSYDLDGVLRGIPHRSEFEVEIDFRKLGLVEIRMEVWNQFGFVNVSGDAPPLAEYLAGVPAVVEPHRIGEMRPISFFEEVLPGNWKTHVDNAFCAYHFAMVHPETLEVNHERSGWTTEIADWVGYTHIPGRASARQTPSRRT